MVLFVLRQVHASHHLSSPCSGRGLVHRLSHNCWHALQCNIYYTWKSSQQQPVQMSSSKCEQQIIYNNNLLSFSLLRFSSWQDSFLHAMPADLNTKPLNPFLPLPFPTLPTLNVHSQNYPRVFIDDIGHADSRDDLQQVGGNSSIKSGHTLLC